ncbi:MAG: transketolase C-terminal domain-containing protein, partial [Cyanobacteria bacterium J06633_1]
PTLLALSRQNLPNLDGSSIEKASKGAYILSDGDGTGEIDLILIGTGSEVQLCVEAATRLRSQGKKVRVVSMPSWELFEAQDTAYRETVLPKKIKKRVAIEAGTTIGWCRYVGDEGKAIGIDTFGASAPQAVVMEKFGFTVENLLQEANQLLG